MTQYSIHDLVPVREGGTVATALADTAAYARQAEAHGYSRYWIAEHHGMPGIAGGATSVVIGHVAAATSRIRVGAGGIMLPNHAPLVVAEQFGTLDALFPGRIDLGLGRAPGSDQRTARALRRSLESDPNGFPNDVMELQSYFADDGQTGIRAVPGAGADVAIWILGSSLFGAQLAAMLGLPYAFASHFAPDALDQAIAIYRRDFRPSAALERPHVMAGFNVFAADTDEEARYLASSMEQSFVALRTGNPGKMQPPVRDYRASLGPQGAAMLEQVLSCSAIGSPATVRREIAAFVERTGVDELMIAGATYDPEARLRSIALTAEAMQELKLAA
ncbi:LLM class flavin-dependent oxidoreductase [Sphingomonas qomolangmaensis]|uniref:LLM class flavin-dependent oxidoreductase n=1 Tax=Sphingomonas qomolangmaensis TaxID=2918765 RepID=A0ABY5L785_9SPHN|nr:LLM class flavin-dependent oxidoreductase [Sphingomonas qomolangmaensis]UUL81539.1 LLM class flavin-dependent oxidoreductase [Sphingomonas qomolangmaensis]